MGAIRPFEGAKTGLLLNRFSRVAPDIGALAQVRTAIRAAIHALQKTEQYVWLLNGQAGNLSDRLSACLDRAIDAIAGAVQAIRLDSYVGARNPNIALEDVPTKWRGVIEGDLCARLLWMTTKGFIKEELAWFCVALLSSEDRKRFDPITGNLEPGWVMYDWGSNKMEGAPSSGFASDQLGAVFSKVPTATIVEGLREGTLGEVKCVLPESVARQIQCLRSGR